MKKVAIVIGVILVLGIIGLIGGQGSDDNAESTTGSTVVIETTLEPIETTEAPKTTVITTIAPSQVTSTKAVITTEKDNSRTVYITPSGKKYHYDAECGGKNSKATTLDKAKSSNYGPCSKCVH